MEPHHPGHRCSKMAGAAYRPEATAPKWENFINAMCCGDAGLADYLQEQAGRSLTGDVSVQTFAFLFGFGRNGKTVYATVIRALLGTYATLLTADFFMTSSKNATQEVLDLQGMRLAVANELPEGTLAEGLIKTLTGEPELKGKALYQAHRIIRNTAKLLMLGNHKPMVKSNGDAIWSRLEPFPCNFRPEKPNLNLIPELSAELDGILIWAIKGLQRWQELGHVVPDTIEAERQQYRQAEDIIGTFLDECCEVLSPWTESKKVLYAKYKEWAAANGFFELSQIMFTKRLSERGIGGARDSAGWYYQGLKLKVMTGNDSFSRFS